MIMLLMAMQETMMRQTGFSAFQLMIMVGTGIVLWYGAGLLLHWLAAAGHLQGDMRIAVYGLVVPGTLPFVLLLRRMARLAPDQTALGVGVAVTTALLIDGIVVAWFPQVYGDTDARVLAASAVILWGAGVAMSLGLMVNRARAPGP